MIIAFSSDIFDFLEHILTYVSICSIMFLTYVRKEKVCLKLQNAEL